MWKGLVYFTTICLGMAIVFASLGYGASESPAQDVVIKARQNTKLQPVPFSHATHVDKQKIDCATCHHKDAAKPKACSTCHAAEGQEKATSAKEPFHGKCRTCHKEQVAIKCHYCHHKPEARK
jgi:hypothetical protein